MSNAKMCDLDAPSRKRGKGVVEVKLPLGLSEKVRDVAAQTKCQAHVWVREAVEYMLIEYRADKYRPDPHRHTARRAVDSFE